MAKSKPNEGLICRAVTFPVATVEGEWKEFMATLHGAWRESTSLANWTATELAKADAVRKATDKKLKPMPAIYLYGLAKKKYPGWAAWAGAYACANSVMRGVEKKYRKARFDLLWNSSISLPTHRYPYPYPVHNKDWTPTVEDGKAAVSVPIGGQRWTIRLKSGAEFKRQLVLFRQLVNGAKRGELSIYRQGSQGHVMVKLVGWFPKPPAKSGHTMLVRTDPNAFIVAEIEGRAPWILNADHVRRWIEAHRCCLQRISEDTKREKRMPADMRRNIDKSRDLRCEKQNNRLDSWTHEASAMLVGFAVRGGVGEVWYDDANRDYLPKFPWHQLKTKLAYKFEAAGIAFTCNAREAACV